MKILGFAIGLLATLSMTVSATVRFVDVNATNPVSPYIDWSSAATNIQDALDVAQGGDTVLVTNGLYLTGGLPWYDSGTNRVSLTNGIVVQSINGPAVTTIQGSQAPGASAVRCAMLAGNAMISGFTLTGGKSGVGNYPQGGGVYCASSSIVSNCVLNGNIANTTGGGAYGGTLVNCLIRDNFATNGGGGAYSSKLVNCILTGNWSRNGGGMHSGSAYNCSIVSNTALFSGGGVYGGGGAWLYNSIIYFNSAPDSPNLTGAKFYYSCTSVSLAEIGNITNAPNFVDLPGGNLRLQSNSPCINGGRNSYMPYIYDLDWNAREAGGTVDMGAYEFQSPQSVISYAWLQQYHLLTDGSADYSDNDGDSYNNFQEWCAGTDPTNNLSVLVVGIPAKTASGIVVTWQSVALRTYFLSRASNLSAQSPFSIVASNILGRVGLSTTTYRDTNAVGSGPFYYRVGVQE